MAPCHGAALSLASDSASPDAENVYEDVEQCLRSVQSKDARLDGWFFTAVITTGIYCRPCCPVAPPKPEHMRFWRIWFYLLEACGLDVQLVNARDVKNAPGRPKASYVG